MSVAGFHLCPLGASPSQTATVTEHKPAASLKGPGQGFCVFYPITYTYTFFFSSSTNDAINHAVQTRSGSQFSVQNQNHLAFSIINWE